MNTDRSPDLPGEDLGAHVMAEDGHLTEERAKKGRPLLGLLVAQFLGSFNDNAWKQIVILLAISSAASEAQGQERTAFAQIVLMIPFVLVSLPAGVLADRVGKSSVLLSLKLMELC